VWMLMIEMEDITGMVIVTGMVIITGIKGMMIGTRQKNLRSLQILFHKIEWIRMKEAIT